MICSSLNRELFSLSVSFVGTDSTSTWRRKRVSAHNPRSAVCQDKVARVNKASVLASGRVGTPCPPHSFGQAIRSPNPRLPLPSRASGLQFWRWRTSKKIVLEG